MGTYLSQGRVEDVDLGCDLARAACFNGGQIAFNGGQLAEEFVSERLILLNLDQRRSKHPSERRPTETERAYRVGLFELRLQIHVHHQSHRCPPTRVHMTRGCGQD